MRVIFYYERPKRQNLDAIVYNYVTIKCILVKVFKNGPSKICVRQSLKNLK